MPVSGPHLKFAVLLGIAGALVAPVSQAASLLGTPLLVARIVLSNAVVADVYGGLFWAYGLERAMLAHFCTDRVLHVALPLAGSL